MASEKQNRTKSAFSFPKELRTKLAEVDLLDPDGRTHGRIIVDKAVSLAAKGNMKAMGEVLDRLLGKPAQSIALDATIKQMSAEEEVAAILESLAVLQAEGDGSNERVN